MTSGTVEESCVDERTMKLRMKITHVSWGFIDDLSSFSNRWDLDLGTFSIHLRQNIPFMIMEEKLKIQQEFWETTSQGLVGMTNDGTSNHV